MSRISIPVSRIAKDITVTLTVTGVKLWTFRVNVAAQIFRFGAWVMGCQFQCELANGQTKTKTESR